MERRGKLVSGVYCFSVGLIYFIALSFDLSERMPIASFFVSLISICAFFVNLFFTKKINEFAVFLIFTFPVICIVGMVEQEEYMNRAIEIKEYLIANNADLHNVRKLYSEKCQGKCPYFIVLLEGGHIENSYLNVKLFFDKEKRISLAK